MSFADTALVRACASLFNSRELNLLFAIASRTNGETGECFPSLETIGLDASMSGKHAGRIIKKLEALALIEVDRSRLRKKSNIYRLNRCKFDEIIAEFERIEEELSCFALKEKRSVETRKRAKMLRAKMDAQLARRRDTDSLVSAVRNGLTRHHAEMSVPERTSSCPGATDTHRSDESSKTFNKSKPRRSLGHASHPMHVLEPVSRAINISAYELSKLTDTKEDAEKLVEEWRTGKLTESNIRLALKEFYSLQTKGARNPLAPNKEWLR